MGPAEGLTGTLSTIWDALRAVRRRCLSRTSSSRRFSYLIRITCPEEHRIYISSFHFFDPHLLCSGMYCRQWGLYRGTVFCWLQITHPNPSVSFGSQQFLENLFHCFFYFTRWRCCLLALERLAISVVGLEWNCSAITSVWYCAPSWNALCDCSFMSLFKDAVVVSR